MVRVVVKDCAVQHENTGSSLESSHLMQKVGLGLYPIHPSQNPVIMGPTLGSGLFFIIIIKGQ